MVAGRARNPPGLPEPGLMEPKSAKGDAPDPLLTLEDLPKPDANTSVATPALPSSVVRHAETSDESAPKFQRIDPDAPVAEPSPKAQLLLLFFSTFVLR